MPQVDVVITGVGILSPLGIGKERFWDSLCAGRSGIRPLSILDASALPIHIGGEVPDFDPKAHGLPRKSLKVMARDAQLGVAASMLAWRDAGLGHGLLNPERVGVVLGADRICSPLEQCEAPYRRCTPNGHFDFSRWATEGFRATFPLSFLEVLPNMIPSHVSIVLNAQGPSNTIHHAEVSSLLAIREAACAIQRGTADVMLAGGASSQLTPLDIVRHKLKGRISPHWEEPSSVMRPFDALRSGEVHGEGAAVLVLEDHRHALAQGASILGRVLSWGSTCVSHPSRDSRIGALGRAMAWALERASLAPAAIGHVNAHGASTVDDDPTEAQAIRDLFGKVPVTAPKSFFGNLGAAGGAMEIAASVLALVHRLVPPVCNYCHFDPACPIAVIAREPVAVAHSTAMVINYTPEGQAAAMVIARDD